MTEIKKLGKYEIIEELGVGAMGKVYKARDPAIGRLVAIKTINISLAFSDRDRKEFMERFRREARTAGSLSHSNIITIYEIGEDEDTGLSFLAMEYASGSDLKDIIGSPSKIPTARAVEIIKQLAGALDYAHKNGIIHRDVKPANIIIGSDGSLKITDFGIARIPSSELTETGKFLGTPYYMSPEQIDGKDVDSRSDLFSLGVIFYQLLTKKMPFEGEMVTAVTHAIVHKIPIPPSEHDSSIPRRLDRIVMKLLSKDPGKRYQRGKELVEDLEEIEKTLDIKEPTYLTAGSTFGKAFSSVLKWLGAKKSDRKVVATFITGTLILIILMGMIPLLRSPRAEKPPSIVSPIPRSEREETPPAAEMTESAEQPEPKNNPFPPAETDSRAPAQVKEPEPVQPEEPEPAPSPEPESETAPVPVTVKLKHDLKEGEIVISGEDGEIFRASFPPETKKKKFFKSWRKLPGIADQAWKDIQFPPGELEVEVTVTGGKMENPAHLETSVNFEPGTDPAFYLQLKEGTLEIKND